MKISFLYWGDPNRAGYRRGRCPHRPFLQLRNIKNNQLDKKVLLQSQKKIQKQS